MNFKNENNNNNKNMNNEVELNNNKGDLKMNDKTKQQKKDELEAFLKMDTTGLKKYQEKEKQEIKPNKLPTKEEIKNVSVQKKGLAQKELKNMAGIKPTTTINEADPLKSIQKHKEATKKEKAFKDMVKENPSNLLKIEPKKLNQKAFNYMVNLKEEDYKNNIDLTMKLINANAINTALRDLKAFNGKYIKMLDEYSTPYNITVDEFKNIAPTIYNMIGQSKPPELLKKLNDTEIIEKIQTKRLPRAVKKQYEVKYSKMLNEKQLLLNKNVVLTTELLWKLYNIQKGIKALEYIPTNEVNNYVGMVQALFKGLKWKKALKLLTKTLPKIRYQYLRG